VYLRVVLLSDDGLAALADLGDGGAEEVGACELVGDSSSSVAAIIILGLGMGEEVTDGVEEMLGK